MTELELVPADVPAGLVAEATQETCLPAKFVPQLYERFEYAPSGFSCPFSDPELVDHP